MKYSKTALLTSWIAWAMSFSGATGMSAEPVREQNKPVVLCTTFPIYQITRNVAKDRNEVVVQLMLPAQLGCPHDYALTPQDMEKLAKATILVVNGLGMEEFLGAPVKKANDKLAIIDSSQGIADTLQYAGGHDPGHHEHGNGEAGHEHSDDAGYEWAGAFDLKPGVYHWAFAKKGGAYADPAMKMLILAAKAKDPIEGVEAEGKKWFAAAAAELPGGSEVPVGTLKVLRFNAERDRTTFDIKVEKAGVYVFFTEHMPYEFEAGEHFFKSAGGADVEPVAEEPEHAHGHHHTGVNPHLFASPRMAAKLALNIAAGLSKADPQGAAVYSRNAQAYAAKMNKLADEMASLGKRLANNRIVQPHGVFDYLARDMGLEVVGVMQAHGQEPSAAEMIELVKTIKEKKAGGIFTEPQYPEKVGRTLAGETGVPVAMLDPVATGPAGAPLDYFESVMGKNMKTLEKTLGVK
ncbi:MAG TPA: zinc ABC transporter substrate-binding protein [Phycisphaerae bacterium]|nr:zinc ABC transporter substrate-binding protein [Phycisphaerae bacterium]